MRPSLALGVAFFTAATTLASPTGTAVTRVPRGSPPVMDGSFADGGWADALREEMKGEGEVFLKHDGTDLYVGIRAPNEGIGSICVVKEKEVHILHSSFSLGTAVYAPSEGMWDPRLEFSWRCQDADDGPQATAAREIFFEPTDGSRTT